MSRWLIDAGERALATFAEVALPGFVGVNLLDVDYRLVLGLAGSATIASILKSVIARHRGQSDSASLADI